MRRATHLLHEYGPAGLLVGGLVAAWEAVVRVWEIPVYLLPAPSQVVVTLVSRWGVIWHNAQITILEVLAGFAIGVTFGTLVAVLMSRSRLLNRMLYPLVVASQTFPKEALAPLFIVMIGFGLMPKVLIAAMISFFPMTINTTRGLAAADPMAVELFRSLAATRGQVFFRLELPSALPFVFTGMKMSATLSVIGAVVGEFVGSSRGLGHLTQKGIDELQTDLMFASLIVLGAVGVTLYTLVEVVERVGFRRFLRGR